MGTAKNLYYVPGFRIERKGQLKRTFTIFGALTIVFWFSLAGWFLVYPLPLETLLAEPGFGVTATSIVLGIISGMLLIVHPSSGRVLAMVPCALMMAARLWWLSFPYSDLGKKLYAIFFVLLPSRPIYVIHYEFIAWGFFIGTIVFLWRRPTA